VRRHQLFFSPELSAPAASRPAWKPAPSAEIAPIAAVASVGSSADVLAYIVDLARATRRSPSVKLGVSPRGTTALLASAKAWAWLSGYDAITPDHVQAMVLPVWRHRIQLRPEAELEGVSVDAILRGSDASSEHRVRHDNGEISVNREEGDRRDPTFGARVTGHGHSKAADAGQVAAMAKAKRLALVHTSRELAGHEREIEAEAAAHFSGEVIAPADFMTIEV